MKMPDFPHPVCGALEDPQFDYCAAMAEDVLWLLEVGPPRRARVPEAVIETLELGVAELGRFVARMPPAEGLSHDLATVLRALERCAHDPAIDI